MQPGKGPKGCVQCNYGNTEEHLAQEGEERVCKQKAQHLQTGAEVNRARNGTHYIYTQVLGRFVPISDVDTIYMV